jgi:cobalt-zinc-cadmium efflux system protein
MEHSHQHSTGYGSDYGSAFKIGIILNVLYIAIEIVAGLKANSMALIADAGHNFSDVLVLSFSWLAITVSKRKPTARFTYGFRRSTILVALLNTMLLIAAVVIILVEAVGRLKAPGKVDSGVVIYIASAGIIINGITAWLFMKDQRHDLNIRSAFIHFVGDALVSVGVVVSGILITITGLSVIDPIVTFAIVAVILYSSYRILIDSVNLALDAVPENIDIESVRSYLGNLPHVTGVHDLHIWALSTTDSAMTVHLSTDTPTDSEYISCIQRYLEAKFGIGHSTIQIEYGEYPDGCKNCN